MKIKTIGNRIQIKVDELSVAGLDVAGLPTAVECGEVIGLGEAVTLPLKLGDKIMYKSWAVDICSVDGKRYYFISEDTKGICAIVK